MKISDYNYYRLLGNTNLALGNTTLCFSTMGATLYYYGVKSPSISGMMITSFLASGCFYKLAYNYYKQAKYIKDEENTKKYK